MRFNPQSALSPLSGSFYMCPTVECILCSENVYTAHCMKQ